MKHPAPFIFWVALALLPWPATSLAAAAQNSDAWISAPHPDASAWQSIRATAKEFCDRETPPDALPFDERAAPISNLAARKVFIDYFPPYPLSFTNRLAQNDIYSTDYLRRDGERGEFFNAGGFIRDRPLPAGPWASPYWMQINYAIEILRAQRMGAAGFVFDVVDVGAGRGAAQLSLMLDTAAHVAPQFRIVPELDTNILRSASVVEFESVLEYVWSQPAAFHLPDGRLLVTPFAPELLPTAFWQRLLDDMRAKKKPVAFMPVLLDVQKFAQSFAPMSYGQSTWGDRDVQSPDVLVGLRGTGKLPPDGVWMAPVAPQDARPNQSILWEARNTQNYRKGWMDAIHDGSRYVHVITWNDYSESTHIEPSVFTQFVFYDLGAFYTRWFVSGRMPRITQEAIYYTYRREIFQPDRLPLATDTPLKSLGSTPIENEIEMVAFLPEPAVLQIEIDGVTSEKSAAAGLAELRVPARPGKPTFRILRGNTLIEEVVGQWRIVAQLRALNPLYAGGSSNRPIVAMPREDTSPREVIRGHNHLTF